MKVTIDTINLAKIIYHNFTGDCEGKTACYKFCAGNNCIAAIDKALIEEIIKMQYDKNNTLQKSKNVII